MPSAFDELIADSIIDLMEAASRVGNGGYATAVSAAIVPNDDRFGKLFNSDRVTEAVRQEVYKALFKLAQEARDMARRLAPKDTGALAASIYAVHPDGGRQPGGLRRSAGYWRAIKAASRASGGRLHIEDDPELVRSVRTQSRRNALPQGTKPAGQVGPDGLLLNENSSYDFVPMAAAGPDRLFVSIGAAAFYAGYVEYGTVRMDAKPFFRPAVEWARSVLASRIADAVARGSGRGAGSAKR